MIRRTKLILFILCSATVFVLVSVSRTQRTIEKPLEKKLNASEKLIIFHLDLKGAPPKINFLLELMPVAQRAGANALLIEYEDSFPFSGHLRNISAGTAYTVEEIQKLLQLAKDLKMEVIPLVQTFGHLEFVLKLEEFRHLRELDTFPQEICPSKRDSFQLVIEMIDQVMKMHKNVRYLHIGCDEVYHLAACPICSKYSANDVFKKHVKRVAEYVKVHYPGVTPLIWDDMLRHWSPIDIEESGLGEFVEPMIWVYIDDIPRLVPHFIWFVYKKSFKKLWTASAYKGAFGEKQTLPDLVRHVDNTLAWMRLMLPRETENTVTHAEDFAGIALTGWSRYDHFAVLAELLPAAVPSLILNLALTNAHLNGYTEKYAYDEMISTLKCPKPFPFHSVDEMRNDNTPWIFKYCNFPGQAVHQLILNYLTLESRYQLVIQQFESNGWVSEYNIKHRYSSPYRVLQLFPDEGFASQNLLKNIQTFKTDAAEILQNFYHDSIISEWIEQKISPMEEKLIRIGETFQYLIEAKTWQKRPLQK